MIFYREEIRIKSWHLEVLKPKILDNDILLKYYKLIFYSYITVTITSGLVKV